MCYVTLPSPSLSGERAVRLSVRAAAPSLPGLVRVGEDGGGVRAGQILPKDIERR
jgi:hypothetical protein